MLSSKEIAKKWEGIAQGKAALGGGKCVLLGIQAGLFIALGALGCTIVQYAVGGGPGRLLGACVFPAGLILVVMAGGELFTGNCLMAGPACSRAVSFKSVLHNWAFVYLGNMLGALLMVLLAYFGGLLGDLTDTIHAIAAKKTSLSFLEALLRGVGCNVLVCGAVWMASGAQTAGGKAALCFFPVMLFVLCGFEHSVANMFYLPAAMLPPCTVNVYQYFIGNLLPVTLGNILGGAGFAILYAKVYKD